MCGRNWSACIVTEISGPLSFGKLTESILLVTLLKMLNDNIKLLNFEKDMLKFAVGFLLSYSDLFNFEKSQTSQREVTLTVSEIDRVRKYHGKKIKLFYRGNVSTQTLVLLQRAVHSQVRLCTRPAQNYT